MTHVYTHTHPKQTKGEKEEREREREKEREGWKRKESKGGGRKGICLLFLVGLYFLCVLEQTLLFWTLSFPIGKMAYLDLTYLPVHVLPKPEFDARSLVVLEDGGDPFLTVVETSHLCSQQGAPLVWSQVSFFLRK